MFTSSQLLEQMGESLGNTEVESQPLPGFCTEKSFCVDGFSLPWGSGSPLPALTQAGVLASGLLPIYHSAWAGISHEG